MKLIVLALVISAALAGVSRKPQKQQSLLAAKGKDAKKVGKSAAQCEEVAKKFVPPAGAIPDSIIEKAQDYCALKYTADHSYVCPYFKWFIENSMVDEGVRRDRPLNAKQLCYLTEYHLHELKDQTMNVPNMAADNATLDEFNVHEKCIPATTKAMKPEKAIATEKVPDFWYQFCLSQDCAHYLPSRHRWCSINKSPTPQHSNQLCLLVRDFALRSSGSYGASMTAKDMCGMYAGFVDESLLNADAYEYVVHDGSKNHIPELTDPKKALLHSQLLNTAGAHHIRDNSATPVKPDKAGAADHGFVAILTICFATFFF